MRNSLPEDRWGWYPKKVWLEDHPQPMVEWVNIGQQPFEDAFYSQTIGVGYQVRMGKVLTPLADLPRQQDGQPALPLSGLIFHVSRCGSTLLSQWLSLMTSNVMLSEPPPLDEVLRIHLHVQGLDRATQLGWIKAMVSALGQPRANSQQRLFIKLDCWHVWLADLLEEAFPDVPWIFLYRNPAQVVMSHQRNRGTLSIPDLIEDRLSVFDRSDLLPADLDGFLERSLDHLMRRMAEIHKPDRDILMNYAEGNEALMGRTLSHFGLLPSDEEMALLRARSARHSKNTDEKFSGDAESQPLRETSLEGYLLLETKRALMGI
jgi:hypothetical protein